MKFLVAITLSLATLIWAGPALSNEPVAEEATITLYERLGNTEGIEKVVRKAVELHMENPLLTAYVKHLDRDWLIGSVTAFFVAGTGGPNNYTGADMHTAHAHMDLTNAEFDSAVSDVGIAMQANNIDEASMLEVNAILNSFRAAIATGE
jgi:hemoglobin